MLKCRSLWTCLILMITLVRGSAMITYGEVPDGYFDAMDSSTIVGWGWKASEPNTAVPVRVTITNEDTSQVVGDFRPIAAVYRDDLKENEIGNGVHGFRINVDWDSYPDGIYQIEGWVDGKKFANSHSYAKGEAAQAEIQRREEEEKAKEAAQEAAVPTFKSLGMFRTTGYCPCRKCCGKYGGKSTSTGAVPRSNHTIAVDPKVIPYGTKLMINGIIYTAEDCGGAVKGKHVDIFYDTHAQASSHGSRSMEVFLVK